jgi:molecular chaperone GrpE (heat shock protein)
LPAKRLVFEDVSAASAGDAGSADKDEKIKALNAEVADLKGRVLTALADVENMRARMKKSAEEDKKFAVRSFAKGMLEVADCLEKALEAVPEEKRAANADLQSVFEGVELIDKVRLTVGLSVKCVWGQSDVRTHLPSPCLVVSSVVSPPS